MFVKTVRKKEITMGSRDSVGSNQPQQTIETEERNVDYVNLAVAIGFLLVILVAAFYAKGIEWATASDALLTAFTGGAGLVIGALLGESAGVAPPATEK